MNRANWYSEEFEKAYAEVEDKGFDKTAFYLGWIQSRKNVLLAIKQFVAEEHRSWYANCVEDIANYIIKTL